MTEYGTPCPGCRRILHITIDLEGGETAAPRVEPGENEAAAQLVERLAEFRHEYADTRSKVCQSDTCREARKLAGRLRGGFPEPHIQVVGAECGCTIRKGPPWQLEPCPAHEPQDPAQDVRLAALRSFIPAMPEDATMLGALRVMIAFIGDTSGASTIEWNPRAARHIGRWDSARSREN